MKKLFILLTAAFCTANVMAADDGNIVRYDFEHYKLDSRSKYYVWYELDADNAETEIWASGNSGFAMTAGNAAADTYPTSPVAEGLDGACIKLETKSTGFLGNLVKMPLAAGNLFVGTFDSSAAMSDAMKATKFGLPFDKKPLRFTGYYKYKAGATVTDKDNKEVSGKTDQGRIYSVLYRNVDSDGNPVLLNGKDVLTNPNIVAIADAGEITDIDAWTPFEVEYNYGDKTIDADILSAGGYSLTVVFTSSVEGASFVGAVGSTLYVDKVAIECEADASEAKEFKDNLQVTLNTTPMEPQQASIFVTDKGNGKYTLSLPNFILGTGGDAMPIGTITIEDVEGTEADGVVKLSTTQTITIKEGDLEGITGWLGPQLNEIPVTLNAEMTGDKLYAEIDIPFNGMIIKVVFGSKGTGIDHVNASASHVTGVYTIDGMKADNMQSGNIYIIRKADGKTVKVIK